MAHAYEWQLVVDLGICSPMGHQCASRLLILVLPPSQQVEHRRCCKPRWMHSRLRITAAQPHQPLSCIQTATECAQGGNLGPVLLCCCVAARTQPAQQPGRGAPAAAGSGCAGCSYQSSRLTARRRRPSQWCPHCHLHPQPIAAGHMCCACRAHLLCMQGTHAAHAGHICCVCRAMFRASRAHVLHVCLPPHRHLGPKIPTRMAAWPQLLRQGAGSTVASAVHDSGCWPDKRGSFCAPATPCYSKQH